MTETKLNVRYPFMYKISIRLNNLSFYLIVIGLFGAIISFSGLVEIVYTSVFIFLIFVGIHLLSLTGIIVQIAINPMEYFIPMEERERKKKVRDGAVFFSGATLFAVLFFFVQDYTGWVNSYLCVLGITILIDIFCVVLYIYYGNGTRRIKLY